MFQNIALFRTATAMAVHASDRQAVIAENIANVDTPGYRARDVSSFQDAMGQNVSTTAMVKTRAGHFDGPSTSFTTKFFTDESAERSPNGNSVSIETEMLKSLETEEQHSRALAIYQNALDLIKISIGRGG